MNIVILWAAYSSFYTHVKHRYFFSMAHLLTASVKREPRLETRCATKQDPSITLRLLNSYILYRIMFSFQTPAKTSFSNSVTKACQKSVLSFFFVCISAFLKQVHPFTFLFVCKSTLHHMFLDASKGNKKRLFRSILATIKTV